MLPYKGVIKTATGELLRAGRTVFENDGSFNPTETIVNNPPFPPKTRMLPFFNTVDYFIDNEWTEQPK
jgi:hypothetical protein